MSFKFVCDSCTLILYFLGNTEQGAGFGISPICIIKNYVPYYVYIVYSSLIGHNKGAKAANCVFINTELSTQGYLKVFGVRGNIICTLFMGKGTDFLFVDLISYSYKIVPCSLMLLFNARLNYRLKCLHAEGGWKTKTTASSVYMQRRMRD